MNAISDHSKTVIETLYPGVRPLANRVLQDVCHATGRVLNVVQGTRSMAAQMVLYMIGRELVNGKYIVVDPRHIVTNAMPGLSFHEYGLGFDVAWAGVDPYLKSIGESKRMELWDTYGKFVNAHGLKWGGDFRLANGAHDLPHAQATYGLCISECRELFERGGLAAVWGHIDQIRGVPTGDGWKSGGSWKPSLF